MTDPPRADRSTAFFTAEQETVDGWRLPLAGDLVGYLYVRPTEFAFEVWLGGDDDVTVRLTRDFTVERDDLRTSFDPHTSRKSDLAALLALGNLEVAEFLVSQASVLMLIPLSQQPTRCRVRQRPPAKHRPPGS